MKNEKSLKELKDFDKAVNDFKTITIGTFSNKITASKRAKVYDCPNCKQHGKTGTLELLSKEERYKLAVKMAESDCPIPKRIYGCDECKFWGDAEFIEKE